jgi:chromatin segregation and condensation protein Rec8/ScpA/Scc1 (kleisin family)
MSRVEQAVAFLALLELRKADEIEIRQLAPFEPIAVSACSSRTSA